MNILRELPSDKVRSRYFVKYDIRMQADRYLQISADGKSDINPNSPRGGAQSASSAVKSQFLCNRTSIGPQISL